MISAIDNDLTTYWLSGSHRSSNGGQPWIKYYFWTKASVDKVVLINRITKLVSSQRKTILGRLKNTVISVEMHGKSSQRCGVLTNVNTQSDRVEDQTYSISCSGAVGDHIKILDTDTGKSNYMNVAEVKVFGNYQTPGDTRSMCIFLFNKIVFSKIIDYRNFAFKNRNFG